MINFVVQCRWYSLLFKMLFCELEVCDIEDVVSKDDIVFND